jgi:hypothetical protein
MEILNLYLYTGVPILTINLLFYSITTLSTSITSSQNVFKFIYETTDSEYSIYKKQLELTDLELKLKITKGLVWDILRAYSQNPNEFALLVEEITNPYVITTKDSLDFEMVDIKNTRTDILEKIPEPIKLSLNSLVILVQKTNGILLQAEKKIQAHEKLFWKSMRTFCLKKEIGELKWATELLGSRLDMLIKLIGAYGITIGKY